MKLNKDECNYLDVARFIGIYLVIFAHFMFTYHYQYLPDIVYSFHMPFFFLVSGILHRMEGFTWSRFTKLVLSLIVPYVLYSVLGAVYSFAVNGESLALVGSRLFQTFTVESPITGASWFLVSLFWVKLMAYFLDKKKAIVVAVLCIVFTILWDQLIPRFRYDNIFVLRTSIASFPFLVVGYLLKDVFLLEMKMYVRILLILFFGGLNLVLVSTTGTMSIANVMFFNVYTAYIMALSGSIAVLLLSQLILPLCKFSFIKDISRGTMVIVGMHGFVMFNMFPSIFFGQKPLRIIIPMAALLLFAFYIVIKLTYNRIPILYGKWKR